MRSLLVVAICSLVLFWLDMPAHAGTPESTVVYIECRTPTGVTLRGSGVVISSDGFVLTARHVLGLKPDEPVSSSIVCSGSVGVADPAAVRAMIPQPITLGVDVALLQFRDQGPYTFMPVCKLETWMIRRPIFVAGYPGKTDTGAPSFREGVLSTTIRNSKGVLETDGQTITGMSGGPVFSKNLKGLIGIVIGAQFSAEGVSYFGILPIEKKYIDAFQLTESSAPCFHRESTSEFGPIEGSQKMNLNVSASEAVCYLSGVEGMPNSEQDSVRVEIKDGEYWLNSENKSGGVLKAWARCAWFE